MAGDVKGSHSVERGQLNLTSHPVVFRPPSQRGVKLRETIIERENQEEEMRERWRGQGEGGSLGVNQG